MSSSTMSALKNIWIAGLARPRQSEALAIDVEGATFNVLAIYLRAVHCSWGGYGVSRALMVQDQSMEVNNPQTTESTLVSALRAFQRVDECYARADVCRPCCDGFFLGSLLFNGPLCLVFALFGYFWLLWPNPTASTAFNAFGTFGVVCGCRR